MVQLLDTREVQLMLSPPNEEGRGLILGVGGGPQAVSPGGCHVRSPGVSSGPQEWWVGPGGTGVGKEPRSQGWAPGVAGRPWRREGAQESGVGPGGRGGVYEEPRSRGWAPGVVGGPRGVGVCVCEEPRDQGCTPGSTPEAPEAEHLLASSREGRTMNIIVSKERKTTHQVEQGKRVVYLTNNLEQSKQCKTNKTCHQSSGSNSISHVFQHLWIKNIRKICHF